MKLPFTVKGPRSKLAPALLVSFFVAGGLLSIAASAEDAPADKSGGVSVEIPQSPPLAPAPIGYIRVVTDHPRPASRVDVEPIDAGIAGAKMAVDAARDLYTRRGEGISIWVARSADIHASSPGDRAPLFEPSNDKVYRHPTFFPMPEEVKHL